MGGSQGSAPSSLESLSLLDDLLLARREFLAGGTANSTVRPAVLRSWQRSQAYGIEPGNLALQKPDPVALDARRRANQRLLDAAAPVLDPAHRLLGDSPHLIALGDSEGYILWLRADPLAASQGLDSNLFEGASWHERDIGSNGLGTALAEDAPVILIGPEHLLAAYVGWTCVGIPLRNEHGATIGALDLSVPNAFVSQSTWGWILSLAETIEHRLRNGSVAEPGPIPDLADPLNAARGVLALLGTDLAASPAHGQLLVDSLRSLSKLQPPGIKSHGTVAGNGDLRDSALQASRITMFIQDRDLRYVWLSNPAPGFDPDAVIGLSDHDLLPLEDAQRLAAIKRRVIETGRATRERVQLPQPDGAVHAFDLIVQPLRAGSPGQTSGVICTAIDISEHSPPPLHDDSGDFLGFVAHELQSPLSVLIGLAQLLVARMEELDPDTRKSTARELQDTAQRLHNLLEGLLLLARPDIEVELEPVLLSRVIQRVSARHRERFPRSAIEFAGAADLIVEGRPVWVEQVLENLLTNAAKYGCASPVLVELVHHGDTVEVAVLDRGSGLSEAEAEQVFEPFHRSENARRTASGLGLGLPISRRLVTSMGGRIWAQPRPGGGAQFHFTLNLVDPDQES